LKTKKISSLKYALAYYKAVTKTTRNLNDIAFRTEAKDVVGEPPRDLAGAVSHQGTVHRLTQDAFFIKVARATGSFHFRLFCHHSCSEQKRLPNKVTK
jgi:hypothetical protein